MNASLVLFFSLLISFLTGISCGYHEHQPHYFLRTKPQTTEASRAFLPLVKAITAHLPCKITVKNHEQTSPTVSIFTQFLSTPSLLAETTFCTRNQIKRALNRYLESARLIGLTCQDYFTHTPLIMAWQPHYQRLNVSGAEFVNEMLKIHFNERSYQPESKVVMFKLQKDEYFYRVHGHRNMIGRWFLRYEDINQLKPEDIRQKFALKDTPIFYTKVKLHEGLTLRMGHVAENGFGGDPTAIQYEVLENQESEKYITTIETRFLEDPL